MAITAHFSWLVNVYLLLLHVPRTAQNSLNTLMCLAAKTTYAVIRGVIAARAETPLVQLAWVPLEGCSAVWSLVRNSCLSMYSSFLGRSLQFILNSQCHSVLLLLPKLVYSILVQICLFLLKSWLLPLWTCPRKQGCTKPSFLKCSSKIRQVSVVETAGKGSSLPTERAKNRGRSAKVQELQPHLCSGELSDLLAVPASLLCDLTTGSMVVQIPAREDSSTAFNETACIQGEIFMI